MGGTGMKDVVGLQMMIFVQKVPKNRSLAGNEQPSTSVDNESERGCSGCSGDDGDRRGDAAAAHPEPAPPRGQRRVLFSRRVKIRRHVAELSAPRRGHHDVAQRRRV